MALSKKEFWALVEESRDKGSDCSHYLERKLREMPLEDFLWFDYWQSLAMHQSNQRKLQRFAERFFGDCGDDSFIDFRHWLISVGPEVFDFAIANPSQLDDYLADPDGPNVTPKLAGFVSATNSVFSDRVEEAIVPKEKLPPELPNTIGFIDEP